MVNIYCSLLLIVSIHALDISTIAAYICGRAESIIIFIMHTVIMVKLRAPPTGIFKGKMQTTGC